MAGGRVRSLQANGPMRCSSPIEESGHLNYTRLVW
jgi:hypothetical protein